MSRSMKMRVAGHADGDVMTVDIAGAGTWQCGDINDGVTLEIGRKGAFVVSLAELREAMRLIAAVTPRTPTEEREGR